LRSVQPENTGRAGGWGRLKTGMDIGRQRWRNAFRPRSGRSTRNRSERSEDRPAGPHGPIPGGAARRSDTPVRFACLRNIAVPIA